MGVTSEHLESAINAVLEGVNGISDLYPTQRDLLATLFEDDNIFYTASTNSGKTLPTILYPEILKSLNTSHGYNFPANPKVLFVTALNSLQLSLANNVQALGLHCEVVTRDNIEAVLKSTKSVLFISPEVLKLPTVTQKLLLERSSFVLKVVDECHLGTVTPLFT